jgi:hypothetical protein
MRENSEQQTLPLLSGQHQAVIPFTTVTVGALLRVQAVGLDFTARTTCVGVIRMCTSDHCESHVDRLGASPPHVG